jgi:hypothetical protein
MIRETSHKTEKSLTEWLKTNYYRVTYGDGIPQTVSDYKLDNRGSIPRRGKEFFL